MAESSAIRIVRREESLRSVRQKGTHMRLLYEDERVEILATEIEPENTVRSSEFCDSAAVHLVIEGGLLLHDSDASVLLLPGDSISLEEGKAYAISNPTSLRSTLWSLLFKKQERKGGGL